MHIVHVHCIYMYIASRMIWCRNNIEYKSISKKLEQKNGEGVIKIGGAFSQLIID